MRQLILDTVAGRRVSSVVACVLGLLLLEYVVCRFILARVSYTEIDWKAYMQEVEGWVVDGDTNYYHLKGGTGPLVYPAAFLYLYAALRWIAGGDGSDIAAAQQVFFWLYLATVAVVLTCMAFAGRKKSIPLLYYALVCFSRRTHSIFLLRLFNDAWCVALVHLSVLLMVVLGYRRLGCIVYSLAVGVKMNAFLWAPGIFVFLLGPGIPTWRRFFSTLCFVAVWCGIPQILIGLPFLTTHPIAYLHKSFELSRVFFYKWTVNFKFLPEEVFVSPELGLLLLAMTIILWLWFAFRKWLPSWVSQDPLLVLYSSNFIGVAMSRTIHYQFYCWYSFTIPYLLCRSQWTRNASIDFVIKMAVWGSIEYAYNVPPASECRSLPKGTDFCDNPATPLSSALLQLVHVALLVGLARAQSVARGSEPIGLVVQYCSTLSLLLLNGSLRRAANKGINPRKILCQLR
ncbi:dolichyl-P-Man:Man(5)GlcNAc(2)-PP-dolichol alpha-1,3-mannosyltransferase [Perkinsus olseni]|uniref:dolichyl-P-Man:Man5GlcNAc2-PP-dolichol alpha-1,3-mannosyltransferase n=1 Tax=Perkinsus olseni TaxID=32597 RepID=A0A7J6M177_PEROL|nr:dolichyl-P-Man:Man(5)GlcNAc(2)-PP-dolichol alpha-1,3-mannosyltransferase [Perkinsus olseni]